MQHKQFMALLPEAVLPQAMGWISTILVFPFDRNSKYLSQQALSYASYASSCYTSSHGPSPMGAYDCCHPVTIINSTVHAPWHVCSLLLDVSANLYLPCLCTSICSAGDWLSHIFGTKIGKFSPLQSMHLFCQNEYGVDAMYQRCRSGYSSPCMTTLLATSSSMNLPIAAAVWWWWRLQCWQQLNLNHPISTVKDHALKIYNNYFRGLSLSVALAI